MHRRESSKIDKANKKYYGACGVVRGRDFEDRHPVMAAMLALGGIVVLFILMVIM